MALSRWSPMGELAGLHTALDRLFSDFFGGPLLERSETSPRSCYLAIDVVDKGEAYEVRAAVPGFQPQVAKAAGRSGLTELDVESGRAGNRPFQVSGVATALRSTSPSKWFVRIILSDAD